MKQQRKYEIDNLRWICILLLIPFHGAMAWNTWEGNYIWFEENKVLSSLIIFITPWYMPLMFVLAGISARFALMGKSYGQFAKERVNKLLIPLLSGTLTVVAFMAYMADCFHNQYRGGFIAHYKLFFTNLTDMTGYDGAFSPGHLWFMLFLLLISLISLIIIMLQRKFFPNFSLAGMKTYILPVLCILPFVMTPILDFGGKSIGQYLALYLLGYYVLAEDNIMGKLAKYKYVNLSIVLLCDVLEVYLFVWQEQRTGWGLTILHQMTMWFGILSLLGIGKCFLHQNNKLTGYLSQRSFTIYIFHFGWLIVFQYLLGLTLLPISLQYILAIALTLVFTLLTCELIRRIPGVRWLFGIRIKTVR